MTLQEAGGLVSLVAELDGRVVSERTAVAWHSLLAGLSAQEARDAVRAHYAVETRRIMPADVLRLARRARRAGRVENITRTRLELEAGS